MKKLLKYFITFAIGLVIFLIIILSKSIFSQTNNVEILHILVDASFVPGVLILGFGLLVLASNGGTFDMLSYGIIRFFGLFQRDITKTKYRTFYDYRVAKSDNKPGFGYLVIVGLIYIAISLIFLMFYYKAV